VARAANANDHSGFDRPGRDEGDQRFSDIKVATGGEGLVTDFGLN
jgi:hypothetical protein